MKTAIRFLALTLFALPLFAQAQRTFVSAKLGNDLNPCTLASPCRNLQRGVDAVASGGEVIPLDSGGYGTILIQKAVSISTPAGIHAGVTTTSPAQQYAIIVASTGTVSLRGLAVTNLGGWGGIYTSGGGTLRIDSCRSENGNYSGIIMIPANVPGFYGGTLIINDTVVSGNAMDGISAMGSDTTHRALVSVNNVQAAGNGLTGVTAWENTDMTVRNSVMFNSYAGVEVVTQQNSVGVARMTITGSVIDGNVQGIEAYPSGVADNGIVRIAHSIISHNSQGLSPFSNGKIYTEGDNTVAGNAAGEVFAFSFTAQ